MNAVWIYPALNTASLALGARKCVCAARECFAARIDARTGIC